MNTPSFLQYAIASPLPMLPTEVIEEVIDQASDNRGSLRTLSLLCKSLRTRACFHLFTGIVIRNVEQMESSREFLDSHPWVLPLVQKVTLSIKIDEDNVKPHIPLLDIIRLHLLSRLPNLHTWRMNASFPDPEFDGSIPVHVRLSFNPSTLLCYRIHGRHIQNLELAGIPVPDISHFSRLVSAFTGLRSLTCSDILVRKELQAPLLDSDIIRKLSKPLKTEHLSVDTTVDIRLVEYLLRASGATLHSFAMTISDDRPRTQELKTYFERLEECIDQLSMLFSITLVPLYAGYPWFSHDDTESIIQHIRWATKILEHFRGSKRLGDVRVQFELPTISTLGGPLSRGGSSLEACTALEELLLTFPTSNVQLHLKLDQDQVRRVEFWSPIVKSAFPRLDVQGRLTLPKIPTSSVDLLGHENSVTSLVTSPDSKWIVTGSQDGTIIVWNAEGGAIMHDWLAHWGPVQALSFSPDGRQLGSAGGESGETLVIWDLSNRVLKVAVLAYIDEKDSNKDVAVFSCTWSPDGTLVASTCRPGPVYVWDALTFKQRNLLPVSASNQEASIYHYSSLHWSSDSCYLAWTYTTSKGDGPHYHKWAIWSPHTAELPKTFPSHPTCHNSIITKLLFDPESRRIATALTLKGTLSDSVVGGSKGASGMAGTSDGHSGCVLIWDIASGTEITVLGHDSMRGADTSFSSDGRSLLSLGDDDLKIWDTDSWQVKASLEGDWGLSRAACFSPDGKYVAIMSNNEETDIYTILLWRIGETLCTTMFTEHEWRITYLSFSPNGEFLASGDCDGIVHIRRLADFIGK